jgi:hypothetical protein
MLTQWLFDTQALRICPDNRPFWYTSGSIGPYYINTHFLCGGEKKAQTVLDIIDGALALGDKPACPRLVGETLEEEIAREGIFARVIDCLVAYIKAHIPLSEIRYISGGERRDWFFSLPVARRLGLPHIALYKDLSAVLSDKETHRPITAMEPGASTLHIADLITEASSYERAWAPAIEVLGGRIAQSLVVIDRMQGGAEVLSRLKIGHHALVSIDMVLFDAALDAGLISPAQYEMVAAFIKNPHASMQRFLRDNPDFIKEALSADSRTASRALLCLEKDIYGLGQMGFTQKP